MAAIRTVHYLTAEDARRNIDTRLVDLRDNAYPYAAPAPADREEWERCAE